jgi:hypothetical protein
MFEEGRSDSELLKLAARCIEDHITFINVVCFVSKWEKHTNLMSKCLNMYKSFLDQGILQIQCCYSHTAIKL